MVEFAFYAFCVAHAIVLVSLAELVKLAYTFVYRCNAILLWTEAFVVNDSETYLLFAALADMLNGALEFAAPTLYLLDVFNGLAALKIAVLAVPAQVVLDSALSSLAKTQLLTHLYYQLAYHFRVV